MNSTTPQTIADKVFSYDVLNKLDKAALLAKYDVSGAIYDTNAAFRSQKGQSSQTGNVIYSIPPQGIIISTPGTYTFSKDLTWAPWSLPCAAITIAADNVVIDMAGFNLTATVQDNSQFIAGIFISGNSSVTIKNGTLAQMGFYGICAEGICANGICTKPVSGLTIENVTVSGLEFDNLDIRNLCPTGIHVNHASQVTLTGCTVQYQYVTADSSAGIQLLNTSSGTVSGCQVGDLVNYDGSVQGYSYIGSTGITTSNCSADRLQSHFNGNIRTLGHTVLGFVPIFCLSLTYENCSATDMVGCCDDCHGMSVFLNAEVTVNNFTANTVSDGVAPYNTGAKATGLEVYGAAVSISNCSVENIKAINPQDKQSTGFSAWGAAISFTGCTATNVVVCDEKGNQNPALGHGTGFGWAPDPRALFRGIGAYLVAYKDCSASDCQVGFDTWNHVDSTWTNPSYINCGTPILAEPGASRTLSCNPCSECTPPITATIKNMASGNTYPGS